MSSKTAVLLCGEFRAWPRAAEYIFKFVEHYYENVDYYFATWSTTRDYWRPEAKSIATQRPVTEIDVTSKFGNRNLINYKIIDISTVPQHHISFFYQTHLAKIVNILKRRYELDNDIVYDQVIELRPDVYIPIMVDKISDCKDFEYSIVPIYRAHGTELPSMGDLYFRTNSFGNDVLSTRNYYNKLDEIKKFLDVNKFTPGYETMPGTSDVHWILLDFLYKRRMFDYPGGKYESNLATVIRPNFPDDLDAYSINEIRNFSKEWIRIQWQEHLDIDF